MRRRHQEKGRRALEQIDPSENTTLATHHMNRLMIPHGSTQNKPLGDHGGTFRTWEVVSDQTQESGSILDPEASRSSFSAQELCCCTLHDLVEHVSFKETGTRLSSGKLGNFASRT